MYSLVDFSKIVSLISTIFLENVLIIILQILLWYKIIDKQNIKFELFSKMFVSKKCVSIMCDM